MDGFSTNYTASWIDSCSWKFVCDNLNRSYVSIPLGKFIMVLSPLYSALNLFQ